MRMAGFPDTDIDFGDPWLLNLDPLAPSRRARAFTPACLLR